MDFGTGRIGEIKKALENAHGCSVTKISTKNKLDAICFALKTDANTLDSLIADNAPVARTVKGHCFESYFDSLVAANNKVCIEVGGDQEVDRKIDHITLQLKTPTASGTKGDFVQYKTHKTHGAKSETESMDYYSRAAHFADYLVGLVSYDPLNILIISRNELPRVPSSPVHIQSPFTVNWRTHVALNAFDRIGLDKNSLKKPVSPSGINLLPKSSKLIGVDTDTILNTIINDANFRIWDMSIRGFAREIIFQQNLRRNGIVCQSPIGLRRDRADKADHAIKVASGYRFLQMKGVSTNNCDFTLKDPMLATETQLTRGRVNDHPTQSRLYLVTDFDYLVLALDPAIVNSCRKACGGKEEMEWEFYLIHTNYLSRHHQMNHRLASLQKFKYSDLQKFRVDDWAAVKF